MDAGRPFLPKLARLTGVADAELIRIAVKSLGLEELSPFVPADRIIEYRMRGGANDPLIKLSVDNFTAETASESPAPGGGSVAAPLGSPGASLGAMVADSGSPEGGAGGLRRGERSRGARGGGRGSGVLRGGVAPSAAGALVVCLLFEAS